MATDSLAMVDAKSVATLLRGLAYDVEASPALATRVLDALITLNLLDEAPAPSHEETDVAPSASSSTDLLGLSAARIDLALLFRQGGSAGLRERLAPLPITALRRLIQMRYLDPDRQSARLRSATKLIDFIIERVTNQMERERELTRTASWML